jgi:hypothetical protein
MLDILSSSRTARETSRALLGEHLLSMLPALLEEGDEFLKLFAQGDLPLQALRFLDLAGQPQVGHFGDTACNFVQSTLVSLRMAFRGAD